MELFVIRTADRYLGLKPSCIYRVVEDLKITPVPLSRSCHIGLTYYRGELFDVIDGDLLFSEKEEGGSASGRLILLKWKGRKMGLVFDEIIGLVWLKNEDDGKEEYVLKDYSARLIEPETLWEKVTSFSDGPYKV